MYSMGRVSEPVAEAFRSRYVAEEKEKEGGYDFGSDGSCKRTHGRWWRNGWRS